MDRDKPLLPGPHHRIEGWGGQEDVADGVAMAALPPCVVITCSNGTKEVERKVCVGGRDRNRSTGGKGPMRILGTSLHFQLCRACCVSVMCVWEPEILCVVYFWHMCGSVCSLQLENKRSLILRGSWE